MTADHLTEDDALRLAGGEELADTGRDHLQSCAACRKRVARIEALLSAAGEELVTARPGCPPADELVELPVGAERDHPHVRACPLCQEELRVWRALPGVAESGIDAAAIGPLLQGATGARAYRGAGDPVRGELGPGTVLEGTVLEATVRLEIADDEIVVDVAGAPTGPLQLRLADDAVEKHVPLPVGETRLQRGSWTWAVIEGAEDVQSPGLD